MSCKNANILDWNPRGLNSIARRDAVRDLIRDTHASIICLQETKLAVIDAPLISAMLGQNFTANFAYRPSIGTSGGILLAVSDAHFSLSNVHITANSVSASVTALSDGSAWSITCVYGPQGDRPLGR
jgi:exonuclease III